MGSQWQIAGGGRVQGPMSDDQVLALIRRGEFPGDGKVRMVGSSDSCLAVKKRPGVAIDGHGAAPHV